MKNIDSKSKKLLIILTPIVLLVIVISFSYAYWRISSTQEGINKVDTLDCLSTTITDVNNAIDLSDEFPIPNSEGMNKTPYTFKITNECNIFIETDINLEVLSTSTLNAQYVRASLNPTGNTIDNSNVLTNYPLGTATIGGATSYTLQSKILINPLDSVTYDLRLWLDEPTTTEQGANKIFNSKIVVTVSPTAMPVNLTVNLPSNPAGIYESNFEGATWNQKIGGLTISSVNNINQIINLTNKDTPEAVNLATYIMSLGTVNGVYNEPATDYRYEGENPNNYVSFNGEIWRIIGVFSDNTHGKAGEKLVKIIRMNSIGALAWHKSGTNDWPASSLYNLLNEYYYNGTNEASINYCYQYSTTIKGNCDFTISGITNDYYRNMIENVTWRLGGIGAMSNVETVYAAERGIDVYSRRPTETNGYIGLMYPSDYGYSVLSSSCGRTTSVGSYNTAACGGSAWLRGEGYEWTLMPCSSNSNNAWNVTYNGYVNYNFANNGFAIRPSLYLKSDTMMSAGAGTSDNPYIIKSS